MAFWFTLQRWCILPRREFLMSVHQIKWLLRLSLKALWKGATLEICPSATACASSVGGNDGCFGCRPTEGTGASLEAILYKEHRPLDTSITLAPARCFPSQRQTVNWQWLREPHIDNTQPGFLMGVQSLKRWHCPRIYCYFSYCFLSTDLTHSINLIKCVYAMTPLDILQTSIF